MSWRTVVISSRCKLDLKMGCMVIRSDEISRIRLDEIALIIVENPAISITGCLMNELVSRKIKIIFCDEKRNPCSELVSMYGSHDCSAKLRSQLKWNSAIKEIVWTSIVKEKITKQAELLQLIGMQHEAGMLLRYIDELELNDASNREGHAAKVYFNALFGVSFSRNADDPINAALNYGYSIVLSTFNREISACGYLTQLGLFHNNMFNFFNLSCDLMEPFRIVVDRIVATEKFSEFGTQQKHEMLSIINQQLFIDGCEQYFHNAVRIYSRSVFDALNENDASLIKFYRFCEEK